MVYDAIVVGLGPAGATAAFELGRRGIRVLALEKHRHPRYKVCGGGISARLDNLIGREYHTTIEKSVTRLMMAYKGRDRFSVSFEAPIAYMTMRDRFDAYLTDRARQAGCEIHEEESVEGIQVRDRWVRVTTRRGDYHALTIIGADGTPSQVSKSLFPGHRYRPGVALESETGPVYGRPWPDDVVLIDIGAIRNGYGWVFPKSDHLSGGLATFKRKQQDLRTQYRRFSSEISSLPAEEFQKPVGHLIPYFHGTADTLAGAGAVVVGDAAGLVDPFLGEGIYYAIWSGKLAARAVADYIKEGKSLHAYTDAVKREIYPELRAAGRIAWIVYHFPRLAFRAGARRPRWFIEYGKVLQGFTTYRQLLTRGLNPARWLRPGRTEPYPGFQIQRREENE
jgi:geranylgeranyl reductase family protein